MTDGRENELAAQMMQVTLSQVGPWAVVSVTGEVDMLTVPRLADALNAVLDGNAGASIVVDLSRVHFLDSHGLTALIQAASASRCERLRVAVGSAKPVIRPLRITGLDRQLPTYPTLDSALAATDDAP